MACCLVVEDEEVIRTILAALLADEGYAVQTAADGLEALEALRVSPGPLVVLLDVLMPRLTGTAILRLVEHGEPSLTRHVYIVLTPRLPPRCRATWAPWCSTWACR
jgi:CheY-like chemotaxis protein